MTKRKQSKAKWRELTDEEKVLSAKGVSIQEKLIKELEYHKAMAELELNRGLDANYARRRAELEQSVNESRKAVQSGINVDWNQYSIEHDELLLSQGLSINLESKKREQRAKLREIESDIAQAKFTIEQTLAQIENGVEVK